jgi:hypothetical protein
MRVLDRIETFGKGRERLTEGWPEGRSAKGMAQVNSEFFDKIFV